MNRVITFNKSKAKDFCICWYLLYTFIAKLRKLTKAFPFKEGSVLALLI